MINPKCPYCESERNIKKAFRAERTKQRYLCKDCNRTFTVNLITEKIITRLSEDTERIKMSKKLFDSVEDLTKRIVGNLKKRKRLRPIITKGNELGKETWINLFSDCHCGLKVTRAETGDIGNFNLEIFKKEVQYLLDTIVRILDYHTNKSDTLVIAFLGDMIENAIMRDNQMASIEFQITDQIMLVVEIVVDYIIALSKYFKNIKCFGVYGNHGRMTQNIKGIHPKDSFDRLVYWGIKERIKGLDNISFEFTEAQHILIDVEGWRFWLEHGDTLRGWNGLPFYGAKREIDKINNMLMKFKEHANYMLCGHFHNECDFENIFMNGGFAGGDLFSIGKMRSSNLPTQALLGVNKKHGVVWKRPIKLVDNPKEMRIKVFNV